MTTLTGGTGGATGAAADVLTWGPPNTNPYQINGDLSIGMWIKLPANAVGTLISSPANIGSPISAGNAGSYAFAIQGSSGAWDILYAHDSVSPASNQLFTFSTQIPNDTWVYIGISRNTTAKTVIFYMAAVGATSLTTVGTYNYTLNPSATANGSLTVGNCQGSGGALTPLTGTIQEHYLWSRELSTAEHLTAMQGNPPLNGMVLGCKMGDTPEVDSSGHGGSGTVTNTTLVQGHG